MYYHLGFTFAFHHSNDIRPLGKQVVQPSIISFYDSCNYNFETFVIDNSSNPKSSFSEIIDISTEIIVKSSYSCRTLQSDGNKWWIINKSGS